MPHSPFPGEIGASTKPRAIHVIAALEQDVDRLLEYSPQNGQLPSRPTKPLGTNNQPPRKRADDALMWQHNREVAPSTSRHSWLNAVLTIAPSR